MKKWVWLLVLWVVLGAACARRSYERMDWQAQRVQVDGRADEWVFPLKYYDSRTKLTFFIANDAQRLYLIFATGDDAARIKTLVSGLKVEIDTAGGNSYPVSLLCMPKEPQRADMPGGPGSPRSMGVRGGDSARYQFRPLPLNLRLAGFKNIPAQNIGLPNSYGIEAALLGRDDYGRLFCELSIPFAVFYKDSLTEADDEHVFAIKVTLDKLEQPSEGMRPNFSMSGGGGGGMGGSPGGGGMGGRGMGSGGGPPGGGPPGGGPPGGAGPDGPGMSANTDIFTKTGFIIKLKPGLP